MLTEGDLTWGDEHTIQYTDDILYSCIPETCIISLANVTPIILIKKKRQVCFLGTSKYTIKQSNFLIKHP